MSYTDLSYFTCPLPEEIERLVYIGDYTKARAQIGKLLQKEKLPQIQKKRLELELLIMDAYEETYTWPKEALYQALDQQIYAFSEAEFEALVEDGTLDYMWIEGRQLFISNACENAIKTKPELEFRMKDLDAQSEGRKRTEELQAMLKLMREKGGHGMHYEIQEIMHLHPEDVVPGTPVKLYMPLPVDDLQCTSGDISFALIKDGEIDYPDEDTTVTIAAEDHKQRTLCVETPYEPGTSYLVEFDYTTMARYVEPDPSKVEVLTEEERAAWADALDEVLPQIAFTPYMRQLAKELQGDETNPLLIARRFYDFVTTVAVYRFVPPYFTKTCIPEYFSMGGHGDCGMHALTFITLCRIAGIPARWQAGWYTKPETIGNHDWACFYIKPYGWLFADGSFGGGAYRAGDYDRWNFYFGNLDPFRMVANADIQQEFDPPFEGLRLDPYDNQTGEAQIVSGRVLKDHEFTLERVMMHYEAVDDVWA